MSDFDEGKKAQIPSWQLKLKPEPAEAGKQPESIPEETSRETVIAQARKFLEEDEVRNSSTDKKITFLESKGLRSEEIEALLGVARNTEATTTPTESASPIQLSPPAQQAPVHIQSSPPQRAMPSQPPIITYPEFLVTPTSPSPLITKNRLLTTLYLFSGLSAVLYGTSTHLLTPMLASLTASRLSLAETASSNLSKLVTRLEGMVSEIPITTQTKSLEEAREEDESDEDPTEMFHRDIGVQTSLPTSPSNTRPGSPAPDRKSVLNDQTNRLSSLKTALQGLVEGSASEGSDVIELEGTIGILRDYLDGMAYVAPTYGYGGVSGYNAGGYGASKDADDEISKVKAGIRGVKGVLLSARSFPGGVRSGGR